jgi:shikimate dehydrogenase
MHGADPGEVVRDLVPWPRLPKTAFAYDVVYAPSVTPFVEAARSAGLRAEGGLGMLVAQAALAFERWLGIAPPRAAMRAAAEAELSKREKAA